MGYLPVEVLDLNDTDGGHKPGDADVDGARHMRMRAVGRGGPE